MKKILFGIALILFGMMCVIFGWFSINVFVILPEFAFFAGPVIAIVGLVIAIVGYREE